MTMRQAPPNTSRGRELTYTWYCSRTFPLLAPPCPICSVRVCAHTREANVCPTLASATFRSSSLHFQMLLKCRPCSRASRQWSVSAGWLFDGGAMWADHLMSFVECCACALCFRHARCPQSEIKNQATNEPLLTSVPFSSECLGILGSVRGKPQHVDGVVCER